MVSLARRVRMCARLGTSCGAHCRSSVWSLHRTNLALTISVFADRPIRLGGTILGAHRHLCAFFNGYDDQARELLPFIRDGFGAYDRPETGGHISSGIWGWK